jgi:hypothetical protein
MMLRRWLPGALVVAMAYTAIVAGADVRAAGADRPSMGADVGVPQVQLGRSDASASVAGRSVRVVVGPVWPAALVAAPVFAAPASESSVSLHPAGSPTGACPCSGRATRGPPLPLAR